MAEQVDRRVVGYPMVGALVAVVAGVVAGWGVGWLWTAANPDADGWAALGAVVVGLLVGTLTMLLAWLVGLISAARRIFPRGRRAGAVVWSVLGAMVAGTVAWFLVRALASVGVMGNSGIEMPLIALVTFLGAGVPAFWLWDRRVRSLSPGGGS